jgi:hypothetical protein
MTPYAELNNQSNEKITTFIIELMQNEFKLGSYDGPRVLSPALMTISPLI